MRGIHRETAQIYQFPLLQRRRLDNGLTAPIVSAEPMLSVIDTCWYHSDAVRDEEAVQPQPKPC